MTQSRKRTLKVQWPMAGLNRRYAYEGQPPYTCGDAKNVRPYDPLLRRGRGGSRPGVRTVFTPQLGDAGNREIRMISDVPIISNDGFTFWSDFFDGASLGSTWSTASWIGTLPSILPNNPQAYSNDSAVGAVRDAVTPAIDSTEAYEVALYISTYAGVHAGKYQIYACMDNTTPVATTDGIVVELIMTGSTGEWTGTLKEYDAGTPTSHALTAGTTDLGYAPSGWLRLYKDGTAVKVYWQDTEILDTTVSLGAGAGLRVGFGLEATVAGGVAVANGFQVQYYTDDTRERSTSKLIASANGKVYQQSLLGQLTQISTNLSLNNDREILAVPREQILYIADYGDPKAEGASATVGGGGNNELSKGGVDWTTYGISTYDDICVLSNGSPDTLDGTYQITNVAAGALTLSPAPGAGTATYRIERGPKQLDPSTGTLSLLMSDTTIDGQIPNGCHIVFLYRDRLCWVRENVVYQSRAGDPDDYNYGADEDDTERACVTDLADGDSGQIGDFITAAAPFSDDFVIYGCRTSIWRQSGDLGYDANIDCIDNRIGIVGSRAWCYGAGGEFIFMSQDGLYMLAPGGNSFPQPISPEVLPKELKDIEAGVYEVRMEYDVGRRGVHIYLVPEEPTGRLHFWFDWSEKSFWPEEYDGDHEPTTIHFYGRSQSSAENRVMLGCRDGWIRAFYDDAETDEGTEITSFIEFGPFHIWNDYEEGVLLEMICSLASNSGDVTWSLRVADTDEEVANSTTNFDTGTWSENRNYHEYPAAGGMSCIIRLENADTDRAWALEQLLLIAEQHGMERLY